MAKYKALKDIEGKTKFNGKYPFTIKQGETVEADLAGGSLNVKLPASAPTPQEHAPIAKLPKSSFELVAVSGASPATNTPTKESASTGQIDLAKEGGSFLNNLWIPVVGANVGMFAGTFYAWHKGAGTKGFLGWAALGSIAGVLVSLPIVVVRAKSQAASVGKKLDNISKSVSAVPTSAPGGDIDSQGLTLSGKIYKRLIGTEIGASDVADFKKSWAKLDAEAKKVVLAVYSFLDGLPAPKSIPAKSEEEAMKKVEPLLMPLIEKIKGFNQDAWKKANAEFGLENIIPMAGATIYKY